MALRNINLTIDADVKKTYFKVDFLADDDTTVVGTDYLFTSHIRRMRDEKDGWWFDRISEDEYNNKIFFSQIVNLNGAPIGSTTQAAVTALLLAAIETEAAQV